ncbi:ATP-dependent helicase [Desmospora profundinema]|uniref:DNA 3'-5' helicase n=1 Tax=Desmospora profundinema TaxID=1571184 RepID=A0ABU1IIE1_9BACL|nr:ATP-dependent helicase [Desmospora profundinema]MDR6224539.1 DNA helicase-2/ATP-dependent DNA helicase PcrA [Desmospora profundinema]
MLSTQEEAMLEGLNDRQREAVIHDEGPIAVFAGPGSGKTTVLTRRVRILLHRGVPPERLMVVTFTRAAAYEMRERLEKEETSRLWMGTFHSLFLRLLREGGVFIPTLLREGEVYQWFRKWLKEREIPADDETIHHFMGAISYCKGNLVPPERLQVKKEKNQTLKEAYQAYEAMKRERGNWDYDDILIAFHRHLSRECNHRLRRGFDHVLVDEFQDVNRVQFESLRLLVPPDGNLFVVGDDDQSIYGFRGSDPRLMLHMDESFPHCRRVVLAVNHRSAEPIVQAGQRLIRHNRLRQAKTLVGTGREGVLLKWIEPADEEEEARRIIHCLSDGVETAVLYRTSTQSRALVDALVREGISFSASRSDASFYRRWQVRDLLSYLALAENPDDLDALVRIVNKPKRYLYGDTWMDEVWNLSRKNGDLLTALPRLPGLKTYQKQALSRFQKQIQAIRGMSATEALEWVRGSMGYDRFLESMAQAGGQDAASWKETVDECVLAAASHETPGAFLAHAAKVAEVVEQIPKKPAIRLMTLHKAKGLEFDRVFLIGLHAMVIPHRRSLQVSEAQKNAAWEEERRLLYVGITRARHELVLSVSQTRQGKRVGPSPFLKELGYSLEEAQPANKRLASGVQHRFHDQPQAPFAGETVSVGDQFHHVKWGMGTVTKVQPMTGSAPGRKITLRLGERSFDLHYELSRQLKLIHRQS